MLSLRLLLFNLSDNHNTNEWVDWIEEAIEKEHDLNYYEYNQSSNIQEIGRFRRNFGPT
jgi:hypothetical protein